MNENCPKLLFDSPTERTLNIKLTPGKHATPETIIQQLEKLLADRAAGKLRFIDDIEAYLNNSSQSA